MPKVFENASDCFWFIRFSDGSERRRSERTTTTNYAGEIKIFRLKKNSSNDTIM